MWGRGPALYKHNLFCYERHLCGSFLNQARMLAKRKSGLKACSEGQQPGAPLTVGVSKISMADYEMFYCYKDQLKEMAKPFGEIKVRETASIPDPDAIRSVDPDPGGQK
jgi:hypothetical protein